MTKNFSTFLRTEIGTFLQDNRVLERKAKVAPPLVIASEAVKVLEYLELAGFIEIKRKRKKLNMHLSVHKFDKPAWRQIADL